MRKLLAVILMVCFIIPCVVQAEEYDYRLYTYNSGTSTNVAITNSLYGSFVGLWHQVIAGVSYTSAVNLVRSADTTKTGWAAMSIRLTALTNTTTAAFTEPDNSNLAAFEPGDVLNVLCGTNSRVGVWLKYQKPGTVRIVQ